MKGQLLTPAAINYALLEQPANLDTVFRSWRHQLYSRHSHQQSTLHRCLVSAAVTCVDLLAPRQQTN